MKLNRLTIICISIGFILFSCKKEKNYRIHGRLVTDCKGQHPVTNVKIILDAGAPGGCKTSLHQETITNSNGEFVFEYEPYDCFAKLSITREQGRGVFGIPVNQDMNFGDLAFENNYNYDIIITSSVTYTPLDTLFYHIKYEGNDSTYKFAVGPFPAKIRSKFSAPYSFDRTLKHYEHINCLLKTGGTSAWYTDAILPFYLYPPCGPEYRTVHIKLP